jgi:hypothetical protein
MPREVRSGGSDREVVNPGLLRTIPTRIEPGHDGSILSMRNYRRTHEKETTVRTTSGASASHSETLLGRAQKRHQSFLYYKYTNTSSSGQCVMTILDQHFPSSLVLWTPTTKGRNDELKVAVWCISKNKSTHTKFTYFAVPRKGDSLLIKILNWFWIATMS